MVNLVPLCRYHHHKVHEGGFTLVLEPDGNVEITRPARQPRPTMSHHPGPHLAPPPRAS